MPWHVFEMAASKFHARWRSFPSIPALVLVACGGRRIWRIVPRSATSRQRFWSFVCSRKVQASNVVVSDLDLAKAVRLQRPRLSLLVPQRTRWLGPFLLPNRYSSNHKRLLGPQQKLGTEPARLQHAHKRAHRRDLQNASQVQKRELNTF